MHSNTHSNSLLEEQGVTAKLIKQRDAGFLMRGFATERRQERRLQGRGLECGCNFSEPQVFGLLIYRTGTDGFSYSVSISRLRCEGLPCVIKRDCAHARLNARVVFH